MDGNISREGITADLEAMAEVGIAGVHILNCTCHIPEGPVAFMFDEWKGLFKHAVNEARRLGIQINMFNSDGWTDGGPWITPEYSMQMLTSSELQVEGPRAFSGNLPQPLTMLDYYRDVAIFVFPTPPHEGPSMLDASARRCRCRLRSVIGYRGRNDAFCRKARLVKRPLTPYPTGRLFSGTPKMET